MPQAICKMAKKIAEPIIAEQIPKYKIDSVDFEALTLGSLPPTFQGLASLLSLINISFEEAQSLVINI